MLYRKQHSRNGFCFGCLLNLPISSCCSQSQTNLSYVSKILGICKVTLLLVAWDWNHAKPSSLTIHLLKSRANRSNAMFLKQHPFRKKALTLKRGEKEATVPTSTGKKVASVAHVRFASKLLLDNVLSKKNYFTSSDPHHDILKQPRWHHPRRVFQPIAQALPRHVAWTCSWSWSFIRTLWQQAGTVPGLPKKTSGASAMKAPLTPSSVTCALMSKAS